MSNLDSSGLIKNLDLSGMYEAIAEFPDQIRRAVAIGSDFKFENDRYDNINNIVVCGMGGSAIGGDLARSLLYDSLPFPMYICRDYHLPRFAGPDTLVIASSYSGSTEETLSGVREAYSKNCRVFAMTTGGELGSMCERHSWPMAQLPTGFQPRAALGFSFVPLMLFLHRLNLSPYTPDDFMALADFLEQKRAGYAIDTTSDDNRAKQLALQLYGRIPIIYSGPELTDAVATRFKGQICENAKMLAFANQFPEFNHNELVGWKIINPFRDYLKVVILRDEEDHGRVKPRMDIVGELIEKEEVTVIEVESDGADRLQRMMSLIQFGDFTSFYLAILNKVDPTPVTAIDNLKKALSELP